MNGKIMYPAINISNAEYYIKKLILKLVVPYGVKVTYLNCLTRIMATTTVSSHFISYDTSRHCEMICPIELLRLMNEFPYKNVSDDMIQHCLTSKSFTDLTIDHKGDETSSEEHGKRIASIIYLIQQGVHIKPVHLYINTRVNEIEDGGTVFERIYI